MTGHTTAEIASQPDTWAQAAALAHAAPLPRTGERVLVVGCGTSWFMAQAYAALRETAGQGLTDAATATEAHLGRGYDRIVAITRSGTTTEVIDLLAQAATPTTVITAVPDSPVVQVADQAILLPFADERSVVQTRFATTALGLLRAHLGEDLRDAIGDGRKALALELPVAALAASQITFLGTGWTYGLANEAALKLREAAQSWTESYVAMEYRHGPLAIAQPGRVVWGFGPLPEGLAQAVAATGASLVSFDLDPMAVLVLAQRLAVARAEAQGLNPDEPRHLTRSVILDPAS
jgi:fructoselysine-6-P-deglycase FrlB-like protein